MVDEPFLNIRHRIVNLHTDFDERGLLGLAFHPGMSVQDQRAVLRAYSGHLPGDSTLDKVVFYSHTNYVAEYQVSKPPEQGRLAERADLLRSIRRSLTHNGHWIGFGPDGFLYRRLGDGGYANDWGIGHHVTKGNGQDLGSSQGQDPPVDVDKGESYSVPADNPFVGARTPGPRSGPTASGTHGAALRHGGSQGCFCADVGQNASRRSTSSRRAATTGGV